MTTTAKPLILLIDDNPDDVCLTEVALRKTSIDFNIIAIESASQALEYLTGNTDKNENNDYPRPDFILLDLYLPPANGLKILQQIKANPQIRDIPVIIFTSSNNPDSVEKSYSLGACSYLKKPTNFDDFGEIAISLGLYIVAYAPVNMTNKAITMKHWLLIDEEEVFAKIMQSGLIRHQIKTHLSYSAAEALDYLREYQPDGVLLSTGLTRDNADETRRSISRIYPDLPIIMISAENESQDASVLSKPVNFSELLDRLASLSA